jgi:hypothetical protein
MPTLISYEVFLTDDFQDKNGEFDPIRYVTAVNKVLAQGWEPFSVQYEMKFGGFIWHFRKSQ